MHTVVARGICISRWCTMSEVVMKSQLGGEIVIYKEEEIWAIIQQLGNLMKMVKDQKVVEACLKANTELNNKVSNLQKSVASIEDQLKENSHSSVGRKKIPVELSVRISPGAKASVHLVLGFFSNVVSVLVQFSTTSVFSRVLWKQFMMSYLKSSMANKGIINFCFSIKPFYYSVRYKSDHNRAVMSKLLHQLSGKFKTYSPKQYKS